MAEYELVAYHTDKSKSVGSSLFGSRPNDEWVLKTADKFALGLFLNSNTFPSRGIDVRLQFDLGYMDVIKHIPYKKD